MDFARTAIAALLDSVLPPRCLKCGGPVARQGGLCAACWGGLRWLGPPWCACCGLPFEFDLDGDGMAEGTLCGACIRERPIFARARAALAYDDASRPLLLGFKHADRTDAAPAFGAWLARAGAELLEDADLLLPVPLHRWRLFARRYNQAALLAQAVGRVAAVPVLPDGLARTRRTRSQGGLDRSARDANVRGAFAVRPQHQGRVAGRRIVLVDDVLTTGATVAACARALRRGGAARVDVLTLARVPRPL